MKKIIMVSIFSISILLSGCDPTSSDSVATKGDLYDLEAKIQTLDEEISYLKSRVSDLESKHGYRY